MRSASRPTRAAASGSAGSASARPAEASASVMMRCRMRFGRVLVRRLRVSTSAAPSTCELMSRPLLLRSRIVRSAPRAASSLSASRVM